MNRTQMRGLPLDVVTVVAGYGDARVMSAVSKDWLEAARVGGPYLLRWDPEHARDLKEIVLRRVRDMGRQLTVNAMA